MKLKIKYILNKLHIKPKIVYRITGSILIISVLIFLGLFINLNVIPMKYMLVFIILFTIITGVLSLKLFGRAGWIEKIISLIISALVIIGSIISIVHINDTYNFIDSLKKDKTTTVTYSVLIKSSNKYKIEDLKDKSIGYLQDNNYNLIEKEIPVSYQGQEYSNFSNMPNDLLSSKVDAIIMEDPYLQLAYDEILDFETKTNIIYTFSIEVNTEESSEATPSINISKEPFILYISGIDTYGNITNRSRSDVNILAVVNPSTYEILLITTPRDYYVQLHNTTGLRDKLTHSGIYGIDMSVNTMEDLYDINIDYYLRVNFNTLINVVDVIGGIDVYSSKSFTSTTSSAIHFTKGINTLKGNEALAFSRERKAYTDGDVQRGKNQQLVIEAIIKKVSSSRIILTKYNNILNTLNGSFETDIETSTIKNFLKFQLDKMPSWNLKSISVDGSDSHNYTYSMGRNYLLYVMEPDYTSVNKAKEEINKILNNQ